MASKAKKIKRAQEQVLEAEKHLKTSLFKWKPDNLLAEKKFADAAMNFKLAGEVKLAIKYYLEAAKYAVHESTEITIAGYYEKAARIGLKTKDKADLISAIENLDKAAKIFSQSSSHQDVAGSLIMLMADTEMTLGRTEKSLATILKAFDAFSTQPLALSEDTLLKCIDTMVKHKQLEQALKMTQQICDLCVKQNRAHRRYPYFVCITVLQCALGDPVAAEESFMQHIQDDGYLRDRDCQIAEDLYTAFMSHDDIKLQALQEGSAFNQLVPLQMMYLAKSLKMFSPKAESLSTAAPALPPPSGTKQTSLTEHADSTTPSSSAAGASVTGSAAVASATTPSAATEASATTPSAATEASATTPSSSAAGASATGSAAVASATTPSAAEMKKEDLSSDTSDEENYFG